ncbi:MAG: IclR family transcriptional regulator [Paenibacillus sp.]|nr:IclR family transcriptional regulator [Paenibacillus sp.]
MFANFKTLESHEYVKYDEAKKTYSLGSLLIGLGNRARELNDFVDVASSFLPEIAELGLTIVLAKRFKETDLIYLAKQEPALKVRLTISTGETFPITAGALGKCYYAFLPQKDAEYILKKIVKNKELPSYTPNSVTNLEEFHRQIEEIRRDGIAESNEEYSLGISGFACPIFDSKGNIVLAIGAYMPSNLRGYIDLPEFKNVIKSSARKISEAIVSLV